jgi:kinesin family member 23
MKFNLCTKFFNEIIDILQTISSAANSRHRRSKSVGNEKWLEHRATNNPTKIGTILQPFYNARQVKSPEMKDITSGPSRYCLITQEPDTEGELETKLYKGDVIPTTSGGAQVIFDGVEMLKELSPTSRKRSADEDHQPNPQPLASIEMVQSRCSIGIEGGRKKKSRQY